jgi:hypothetical protein
MCFLLLQCPQTGPAALPASYSVSSGVCRTSVTRRYPFNATNAEVKDEWSYTSILTYSFGRRLGKNVMLFIYLYTLNKVRG